MLNQDRELVKELVDEWEKIDYDPKLEKFLANLKVDFLNKKNNHSGKLVIFSESKETIDYIEKATHKEGFKKTISISAANRKEKEKTIRLNFDANQDKDDYK